MINTTIYKKRLTDEQKTLKQKLDSLGVHTQEDSTKWNASLPPTDYESEEGDVAMKIEEYTEREALTLELQARYKEVVDALERIRLNTYGKCTVSEKPHPIEKERLDADPSARTCVEHMQQK